MIHIRNLILLNNFAIQMYHKPYQTIVLTVKFKLSIKENIFRYIFFYLHCTSTYRLGQVKCTSTIQIDLIENISSHVFLFYPDSRYKNLTCFHLNVSTALCFPDNS